MQKIVINKRLISLIAIAFIAIPLWTTGIYLNVRHNSTLKNQSELTSIKSEIYNYDILFNKIRLTAKENEKKEAPITALSLLIDDNRNQLTQLGSDIERIDNNLKTNIKKSISELDKIKESIENLNVLQQETTVRTQEIFADINFLELQITASLKADYPEEQVSDFETIKKNRKTAFSSQSDQQITMLLKQIEKFKQNYTENTKLFDKLLRFQNQIILLYEQSKETTISEGSDTKKTFTAELRDYYFALSENETDINNIIKSQKSKIWINYLLYIIPLLLIIAFYFHDKKSSKHYRHTINLIVNELISGSKLSLDKIESRKMKTLFTKYEKTLLERQQILSEMIENPDKMPEIPNDNAIGINMLIKQLAEKIEAYTKTQTQATKTHEKEYKYLVKLGEFNDILRNKSRNIDDMSFEIVAKLADFLHIELIGIYISSQEKTLKLTGSYAYNEQKLISKEIKFADGLVGTCASENNIIFLSDIDPDYLKLTTGFGQIPPNFLYLFPISTHDNVLGVFEIASIHKIDKSDLKFIEKLSRDIALTLTLINADKK